MCVCACECARVRACVCLPFAIDSAKVSWIHTDTYREQKKKNTGLVLFQKKYDLYQLLHESLSIATTKLPILQ